MGTDAIATRIAETADDVVRAWSFAHDRFVARGILDEQPLRIVAPESAIHPQTLVMICERDSRVVATVSAVVDHAPDGVPADDLFHRELDFMRGAHARIVEACLTASDLGYCGAWLDKLRHIWWYAESLDLTHVVFTAHPDEVRAYCHAIGFVPATDSRLYPGRRNAPAVLAVLAIDEVVRVQPQPRAIRAFLKQPIATDRFRGRYQFPASDRWRFAATRGN